ncbi:Uncharacterised protein [Candidatus Tiddalikarchaeum anstoanum]|nr:Uncharacterised protein [Candidatus Tiddalikarchaeum anstoanum]
MKDNINIGEYDRIVRIVFGLMILLLIWFEMLGRIILPLDFILKAVLIITGAALLITGVSRTSPVYYLLHINTNKRLK